MKDVVTFDSVFLYREAVDMRRSLDGLSEIVRHKMGKPLDGKFLFVFVGKSRDRIKLLYWDRTGYALWYKRLEKGKFPWPKHGDIVHYISPRFFTHLLEGVDVFIKPHDSVEISQVW